MKTFGIKWDALLRLKKPLYGICGAGDYRGTKMESHLVNELDMSKVIGEAALYVKRKNGKAIGVCGSFVYDSSNAGGEEFWKLTEQKLQVFDSKPRILDCFNFRGAQVQTIATFNFKVSQKL